MKLFAQILTIVEKTFNNGVKYCHNNKRLRACVPVIPAMSQAEIEKDISPPYIELFPLLPASPQPSTDPWLYPVSHSRTKERFNIAHISRVNTNQTDSDAHVYLEMVPTA